MPSDVSFATKNEIALTLIQEALADQVVQAPVLADAAYGNSYAFRAHLRELNLEFFVQVTPRGTHRLDRRGADDPQRQIPHRGPTERVEGTQPF